MLSRSGRTCFCGGDPTTPLSSRRIFSHALYPLYSLSLAPKLLLPSSLKKQLFFFPSHQASPSVCLSSEHPVTSLDSALSMSWVPPGSECPFEVKWQVSSMGSLGAGACILSICQLQGLESEWKVKGLYMERRHRGCHSRIVCTWTGRLKASTLLKGIYL